MWSVCGAAPRVMQGGENEMIYDRIHKKECKAMWHLCNALAELCAANPLRVVELLKGYLWDDDEYKEIISHKPNADLTGKQWRKEKIEL